jgi:hypothetical protein
MTDYGMDDLLRERIDGDRKYSDLGTECSDVTKVMDQLGQHIMTNE